MRITLLLIGKTTDKSLAALTKKYQDRLKRYCKFEIVVIPELRKRKHLNEEAQKKKESDEILKKLQPLDEVVLLDEKGKQFSSVEFSKWLEKEMFKNKKRLVFIIGGPYGFSEAIYKRADQQLALSKMTFSHEMIRPFFIEQLYRGFTILRNEPYHHQ